MPPDIKCTLIRMSPELEDPLKQVSFLELDGGGKRKESDWGPLMQ